MKAADYRKALAKELRNGRDLYRKDTEKDVDGDPCHATFSQKQAPMAKLYGWVKIAKTAPKVLKEVKKKENDGSTKA